MLLPAASVPPHFLYCDYQEFQVSPAPQSIYISLSEILMKRVFSRSTDSIINALKEVAIFENEN